MYRASDSITYGEIAHLPNITSAVTNSRFPKTTCVDVTVGLIKLNSDSDDSRESCRVRCRENTGVTELRITRHMFSLIRKM